MDKNLLQKAKAPMIALIEKKNIVENKMKRAAALLLLLGFLLPLAALAQQESLTVYDGNGTDPCIPTCISVFDQFTRSQFVIPADDLTAMAGNTISSMKFYTTTAIIPYTTNCPVDVYLMEVDYTAIGAFEPKNNATVVYQGTLEIVETDNGGELTISFDEDFEYKGGNLLVGIENTEKGSSKEIFFYGTYVPYSAAFVGFLNYNTNITISFIPKTTFIYEPTICQKPATLTAGNITSRQATLTWSGGSGIYNLETKADGGTWTRVFDTTTTTSYQWENLSPDTDYQARVQSVCGDEVSGWKSVSFSTPIVCPAPTDLIDTVNFLTQTNILHWTENGEATTWQICLNEDENNLITTDSNPYDLTGLFHESLYSAKVRAYCNDIDQSRWSNTFYGYSYYRDPVTITADSPYFEGFESPEGCPWNEYWGGVRTPDGWDEFVPGSMNFDLSPHNSIWVEDAPNYVHSGAQSLVFPNQIADNYIFFPIFSNPINHLQISFWMQTADPFLGQGQLRLGYITSEDNGFCNTFTEIVSYDNSNENMVQRNTVLDNVPAEAIRLAFLWNGLPVGSSHHCFIDDVEVSINPAFFSPRDIAADNITNHTADITWEGACDSYALRYREIPTLLKEGFEGGTMPQGWTIEGDNQNPDKTWRVGVGDHLSSTGTHSGNYNARITHNTNNQVTYLVTPALDLGEYASAELSFWYVNGKWDNETDEFAVCYRIGNEGEWNELWSTAVNHNTWTSQTVVLAGLADNYQIGFRFTDHYGFGVGLDDIALCEMPLSEWITFSEAESPHTLTGLATETDYEVQVKSNCAGYDDWSESFVFTTMGCEIPANVAVSDLTATGVTVSWTGFNDSYYLSYRQAPSMGTLFSEGFEGGTMPQGWTIEGDNQDPAKTWRIGVGDYSSETGTHSGNYNALITHNTNDQVTYLVTPALDLGEYGSMELSFWYINRKWVNDIDEFAVCYRIGSEGGWNELWSTAENHDTWTSQTVELTGLADNYQIGFRCTDHFGYGVGLDDIVLFDMTHSNWITLSEAESPHTLTGLMPETEYEVKVQGVCDDISTEWCQPVVFSTPTGPAPVATLGTVTATTADLSWTASLCEGYTVKYREKYPPIMGDTLLEEHFDGDGVPEGWYFQDGFSIISQTNHAGMAPNEVRMEVISSIQTPAIDLSGISQVYVSFKLYITSSGGLGTSSMSITTSSDGGATWHDAWERTFVAGRYSISETIATPDMGQSNVLFSINIIDLSMRYTAFLDDIVMVGMPYGEWQDLHVTDTAVTLTNLNPNTMYEVKVVPDCDENKESELLTFTTANPCEAPTNLAVGNLTPYTAEVSWEGFSLTGYEVECYTVPLSEGFEGGTLPEGWTIEGDNQNSATTWRVGAGDANLNSHDLIGTHSGDYNALITHTQDSDETFLVTPPLNLGAYDALELSFWYINRSQIYSINVFDFLSVYYRIGEEGEWNELWSTGFNRHEYWTHQTLTLTGLADNYQIGFMMYDRNGWGVGLDDIVITNLVAPTGEPMTLTVEEGTTATLTGLAANTAYEVRVKANCDAAEYCSPVAFTTAEMETFTKDIIAHTDNGGWYLIASPMAEAVTPTAQNGFLANEYDLYRFNQSANLEWENWKAEGEHYHFNLEAGRGYLYANSGDVTLTFVGTPHAATEPAEVPLAYDPAADFAGWNLVGNPLTEIAFIDRDFYVMNGDRDEIVAAEGNTVELMEGIFVIAEGENDTMTFTPASQSAIANNASLVVNLSQGRGSVIDRAIVRFDSNRTLPKFQLNPNSTKVYIPQGGKDYAVVAAEQTGEMPLNFKAEKNGTYTLRFDTKDVAFDYLHLIDNLTGADVDLLTPPAGVPPLQRGQGGFNYTFTAKTTDYASRFRLVFSAGDAGGDACEPPFAYINNGNIIINGTGTLQIIDILGKELVRKELSTLNSQLSTSSFVPGVYVLRLVGGDTVRTQKIVVGF